MPLTNLANWSKRTARVCLLLATMAAAASNSHAQFTQIAHIAHSARSAAMGGAFVTDTTRHVAIGYHHAFMAEALADKSIGLLWPVGIWQAAFVYNHHGNSTYHEQQAAVTAAIAATPWLQIGVGARYMHLGTADPHYQPEHYVAAEATVKAHACRQIEVVALAGTRPWDAAKRWRALVGITYMPASSWTTTATVESEQHLRLRCGAEYNYRKTLFFRGGMATIPVVATFGIGYRKGMLAADIAVETHQTLPPTPTTTLTLCF